MAESHGAEQVLKPTFGEGRGKIGGVQFTGERGDKTNNIANAERMIRDAAAQGAQVIMTPEVALTGFVGGEKERALAEPIPGPTSEHFGHLARELRVYLLVGMPELRVAPAGIPSQTQLCNAMPVFSHRGDLMGIMRKVHINRHKTGEAIRQFQEALRLKPHYADTRKHLAVVLAVKADSSQQPGASTHPLVGTFV